MWNARYLFQLSQYTRCYTLLYISSVVASSGRLDLLYLLRMLNSDSIRQRNLTPAHDGLNDMYTSFSLLYTSLPAFFFQNQVTNYIYVSSRPRWLSWMRVWLETRRSRVRPPAEVGNILSWRLIMKYFLRSFAPFHWFKKGSCQFLAKECTQYWLTA